MKFTKQQLREIIKEELAVAHLDLINENPALLTKYLPMIQKLAPQLVSLGPAIEQYGPILMQAAEMFKNLDSKDFEKVMASLQGAAGVAAAGKD